MQRVVATYRGLRSYQDEGVVLEYWVGKPGPDKLVFKTYFRKPGDFRFEWISHHPYPPLRHIKSRSVVWSNGTGTFSYWDKQPGSRAEADLGSAIAAATGVSEGAITMIPGMIVGRDKVLWSAEDVRDLSLLEPADFEGTPCVRVRGTLREDGVEIWIGRDDFLIRRIVTTLPPDSLDGMLPREEEIRRNVRFDQAIADDVFDFTPPR